MTTSAGSRTRRWFWAAIVLVAALTGLVIVAALKIGVTNGCSRYERCPSMERVKQMRSHWVATCPRRYRMVSLVDPVVGLAYYSTVLVDMTVDEGRVKHFTVADGRRRWTDSDTEGTIAEYYLPGSVFDMLEYEVSAWREACVSGDMKIEVAFDDAWGFVRSLHIAVKHGDEKEWQWDPIYDVRVVLFEVLEAKEE